MEINKLIEIVKEKITKEIILQEINVEDKSFLHKDHKNNSPNPVSAKTKATKKTAIKNLAEQNPDIKNDISDIFKTFNES